MIYFFQKYACVSRSTAFGLVLTKMYAADLKDTENTMLVTKLACSHSRQDTRIFGK